MPFYKHIIQNTHFRRLCSVLTDSQPENSKYFSNHFQTKTRGITREMKQFFEANSDLSEVMPYIPRKYLRINSLSEHHYLVSQKTARDITDKIIPFMDLSGKQLIAETNAGLGLITAELLERGADLVRMYESCPEFRTELKDFGKVYPNRIELFTKDLFHVSRYAYMDKQDRLNRVENLFRNVPRRSWTDEPCMTVIGPMNGMLFLYYLVRSLALQIIPSTLGRIQTFAIMKAKDYAVLAATTNDSPIIYKKLTTLFNLVFDIELLDTFPKKVFVPWMRKKEALRPAPYAAFDFDKRYLVRINFKKDLPLEAEKLLHFMYFLKQFYVAGNAFVLPKLEKWLPGSGLNLIHPKLHHEDHFEKFSIYTKFKDLSPQQILAVFREMVNHPAYKESSVIGMVQNELMQSETVETDIADIEFESKLIEDFQEEINKDKE